MDTPNNDIVPPQHKGARKDIEHVMKASDENDAQKLFMMARNRLMNVNHWHEYAQPVSATFSLTDAHGHALDRTAEKGDYFRIALPAPGPTEGRGFDWVRIEAIEDRSDPEGKDEILAMRVRPVSSPENEGKNIAHFFNDESSSSFVVERHGDKVKAAVYGRNEVPNTNTSNILDKVRNTVVGITAIAGLSDVQWNNLVKGFIKTEG